MAFYTFSCTGMPLLYMATDGNLLNWDMAKL